MKLSLLYIEQETPTATGAVTDLSIDRAFSRICKKERRVRSFCDIVSRPVTNTENIYFRREVLDDFARNEGLLDELSTLFIRYDKVKPDWLEIKANDSFAMLDDSGETMQKALLASLKTTSGFPNAVFSMLQSIHEALENRELKSRALIAVRDLCRDIPDDPELKCILDICEKFLYGSFDENTYEFICELSDELTPALCSLTDVKKTEKKKGPLAFVRKKSDEAHPVKLSTNAAEAARLLFCEALKETDRLLEKVTDAIYDTLYGISFELDFYHVALDYLAFIKAKSLPHCYPEISAAPRITAKGLLDLFLSADDKTPRVFPFEVDISGTHKAMVVVGANGSGKTTFLRSVGTAQLLCQAGLPITAESATFSVRSGVFSHFSSEEEKFAENDRSGRFESEVKAVSAILSDIKDGALVLLNETFQTTSYAEGSAAIINILRVLHKLGGQYIFVTHLPGIVDSLPDDVLKVKTGKSFGTHEKLK